VRLASVPAELASNLVPVEAITPAVGDGPPFAAAYTTGFGVLKFLRLKRLIVIVDYKKIRA
jgi:hypothetical protein